MSSGLKELTRDALTLNPGTDFKPEQIKTKLTIPEGSEIELAVRPCGEEAWKVSVLLWPQAVEKDSRPLELEFSDCLDTERLEFSVPAAWLDRPDMLVDSVRAALAAGLIQTGAVLSIYHVDSARVPTVELLLEAEGQYMSTARCSFARWIKALNGTGYSKEELEALDLEE